MHRPCMDGRNHMPGMTVTTVASRFYFKLEHFMGSNLEQPEGGIPALRCYVFILNSIR